MTNKTDSAMAQPQFYKKVVALSEKGHADWRIKPEANYEFAKDTNAVLITAVEFPLLAQEYPLVFIAQDNTGKTVQPVAVLGLKPDQNLFLDEKATWEAQYIPAYVRRYPFILAGDAAAAESTYTVCIDESYIGFNRKQGEPLFTSAGKHSAHLEQAITFLKDFQTQSKITEQFCHHLMKLDLLEPMQANIASAGGEKFSVAGFMVISRERLKARKPLELAELVKTDEMGLIYQHLASLENFKKLTSRLANQLLAEAS